MLTIWSLFPPLQFSSVQSLSRVQLCNPMNRSTPALPIHHHSREFTQTHVHQIFLRMDWLALLAVQGTLKGLLQHRSSKASILLCSGFFTVQLSHPYMNIGKTIALTRQTFVGKVMSLLLNILSRFVITFLPRSKRLLISWLQWFNFTICSDFGAQKNKVWHCFHCFPIYFPWSDGTRCHDLRFLNVEL